MSNHPEDGYLVGLSSCRCEMCAVHYSCPAVLQWPLLGSSNPQSSTVSGSVLLHHGAVGYITDPRIKPENVLVWMEKMWNQDQIHAHQGAWQGKQERFQLNVGSAIRERYLEDAMKRWARAQNVPGVESEWWIWRSSEEETERAFQRKQSWEYDALGKDESHLVWMKFILNR